jgi:hypothetical protein
MDDSWINDYKRLVDIQELETSKECMESIRAHFIYINLHSYIDKIITETVDLQIMEGTQDDGSYSILSNDLVLQLIQSKKFQTPVSNYRIQDILLYNVLLEPNHIQNYAKSDSFTQLSSSFFSSVSVIQDIVIQPSVFVFHPVNSIYFIFREYERNLVSKTILTKPILKRQRLETAPLGAVEKSLSVDSTEQPNGLCPLGFFNGIKIDGEGKEGGNHCVGGGKTKRHKKVIFSSSVSSKSNTKKKKDE